MAISSTVRTQPNSPHVSDPIIQPFLQPDFDPANFLNNSLPSLSLSTRPPPGTANITDLSSQTQSLLAQLNAQTARLSTSLTQLTDEIIRSGGRLAYEVEVLRGETTGLTDTLENGLKKDIELLAPARKDTEKEKDSSQTTPEKDAAAAANTNPSSATDSTPEQPAYLESLRTLSTLRERLDSVIRVFGAATAWPVAPSEVSSGGASNFISVSSPEANEETRNLEEKAKAYTDTLRSEVADLLSNPNDAAGLSAASARVEELRVLAEVWKGTVEEKARGRVVEGLRKMVEEKQKSVGKGNGNKAGGQATQPQRGVDMRYGDLDSRGGEGGYGFLQGLRDWKDGMYND